MLKTPSPGNNTASLLSDPSYSSVLRARRRRVGRKPDCHRVSSLDFQAKRPATCGMLVHMLRATRNQKSSNVFNGLNFKPFKINDLTWIGVSSILRTPHLTHPTLDWWSLRNLTPSILRPSNTLSGFAARISLKPILASVNILPEVRDLDYSPEFNASNFRMVEYVDAKGEARTEYAMTRDGFTFLAMGFTGKEAARWKENYIAAFNAMEQRLLPEHAQVHRWIVQTLLRLPSSA